MDRFPYLPKSSKGRKERERRLIEIVRGGSIQDETHLLTDREKERGEEGG